MIIRVFKKELSSHVFFMADPDIWTDIPQIEVGIEIPKGWGVASCYAQFGEREIFEVALIRAQNPLREMLYDVKRIEDYDGKIEEYPPEKGMLFSEIPDPEKGDYADFTIQHGPFMLSKSAERPFS